MNNMRILLEGSTVMLCLVAWLGWLSGDDTGKSTGTQVFAKNRAFVADALSLFFGGKFTDDPDPFTSSGCHIGLNDWRLAFLVPGAHVYMCLNL